jgi:hypothetical protein
VTAALAAALLLFAAAFAPVGLAQDAPPRPQGGGPGAIGIAAEVNGAPITRRDLAEELSLDPDWLRLERQSGKANEQLRKTIRRRALDLLIDDILIAQAAKRRKVSFTPDEERDLENRFEEWARESYGSVEAFGEYLRDRGSTLAKQKERFWNHFRLLSSSTRTSTGPTPSSGRPRSATTTRPTARSTGSRGASGSPTSISSSPGIAPRRPARSPRR